MFLHAGEIDSIKIKVEHDRTIHAGENMTLARASRLLIILWVITGCGLTATQDLPALMPTERVPTVIALTVAARGIEAGPLRSITPTMTAAPEQPAESPTETLDKLSLITSTPTPNPSPVPTATLTLDATVQPPPGIPEAAIQITYPGPGSLVSSPFLLRAVTRILPKSTVRIELLGEDGRLLMREVRAYYPERQSSLILGAEINFEISPVAEVGQLQVSLLDEYNRYVALSSIEIILLSIGEALINPQGDTLEDIVIQSPRENSLIQGGVLRVSGLARLRSQQPLLIELQSSDGKIVGSRQVAVDDVPGSSFGSFLIDVPYTVSSTTRVRLMVWEPGELIPGITHLSSVEVILSP